MEMNFASRGIGAAALTTGIIGTAGAALNLLGGGLGNVLGGNVPRNVCPEDHVVNRYEAAQAARIAELETEVKLRDANTYTDQKILEMYKYVDGKFGCVDAAINAQAVYNATNTATINCINGQVTTLMGLVKTVIPIANICPTPAVATTTAG
jgi:hypothetical protein